MTSAPGERAARSRRRALSGIAALAAAAIAFGAFVLAAGARSGLPFVPAAPVASAQTPAAADLPWIPFKHDFHVHGDWLAELKDASAEVDRDCQGCHGYAAREGNPDPQQTCEECHFNATAAAKKAIAQHPALPIAAQARAKLNRFAGTFYHSDHLEDRAKNPLECKTCHHPSKTPVSGPRARGGGTVPDRMNIPQGIEWCIHCHDATKERPPATSTPDLTVFTEFLNAAPALGPEGEARFAHDDHLVAAEFDSAAACDTCHGAIRKADHTSFAARTVRFASGAGDGCGECHVKKEIAGGVFAPVPFRVAAATEDTESLAKGTFSHAQHLSEQAKAKSTEALDGARAITKHDCLACHSKRIDPATGRADFVRADGRFASYEESCAGSCHFHKQPENWFPIPDHGEVDSCAGCHDFGLLRDAAAGVTMKTNRPRAAVARAYGDRFVVYSQSHPFIAASELNVAEIEKQCGKCHQAALADLPSRLNERAFRHETHLPQEASGKDCLPCHGGIERTDGSAAIASAFPGKRIYKEDSCVTCHTKGVQRVAASERAMEATVPSFPHDKHLGADAAMDGKRLECGSCHTLGKPTPADPDGMTTSAGAKDCSECHDHEEHAQITSGKDAKYIADCARCHVKGVPAKGETVTVERVKIRAIEAQQYHPTASAEDQAALAKTRGAASNPAFCEGCHRTATGALAHDRAEDRPQLAAVSAAVENAYARRNYKLGDFHADFDYRYGKDAKDTCYRCHWNDLSKQDYRPRGKDVGAMRREFGAIKPPDGYPGPKK